MEKVIYVTIVILLVNQTKCFILPGLLIQNKDYAWSFSKPQTIQDNEYNKNASNCNLESSYFCSQVDDYPVEQVDSLVQRMMDKGALIMGADAMTHVDRQRSNVDQIDGQMCETERSVIIPKLMKNRREEPTLIVQSQQLSQKISVERCSYPNEGCLAMVMVPALYETYCKQIFSSITLMAVDPVYDQLYKEVFEFPTCCQCAIRSVWLD